MQYDSVLYPTFLLNYYYLPLHLIFLFFNFPLDMHSTKINNANHLSAHTPVPAPAPTPTLAPHPSTHLNPSSASVPVPVLSLGLHDYNNNYNCNNNCNNNCNDKIDGSDRNVKGK